MSERKVLVELPAHLPLRDRVDRAREFEDRGFDGLTLEDVAGADAFVGLALMAERTERISLATCVVQLGVRTVPSMAVAAATLQEVSGGRFRLGLGVSSEVIVSGWHGREWHAPLTHASESLQLLRTLLSGEKSQFRGEAVQSVGFQLSRPPTVPVPAHLGALNRGMVTLAAREADGVWLNYLPRHAARNLCSTIDAAALDAGRPACRKLLAVAVEVTDDRQAARDAMRSSLAFYMTSPAYRRALAWHGYEQEMQDAKVAFERRDRAAVMRAVTGDLIDSIACIGSAAQVRDAMEEYFDSGIDELSVSPLTEANAEASLAAAVGARVTT